MSELELKGNAANAREQVEAQPVPSVRIEVTMAAKLNFADYQNSVPVLRELSVVNDTGNEVNDLELSLSVSPPYIRPKTWRVDVLEPGGQRRILDLDVETDGLMLSGLTEAEGATVVFAVRSVHEPALSLGRHELRLDVLARNQWGGLIYLPEMIAAFVQPNDRAVEQLLKQAAGLLERSGKNPAINGYHDGPRRAWEQAAAIWGAVVARNLDYALPPASFETHGQKVRGPSHILESGLATCLDLVLLFSAALEQAGLNPLVVFVTGHALCGLWLCDEGFSTVVIDDIAALRKRMQLKELLLFETTLATKRPHIPFQFAVDNAEKQVAERESHNFELIVDIRCARKQQRIKPLSSAEVITAQTTGDPAPDKSVELFVVNVPDLPDAMGKRADDEPAQTPLTRLARWQRKLLDLSLRNSLLNFKLTTKSLKVEAPEPGAIEDRLADGQALKLLVKQRVMGDQDPRSQQLHEVRTHEILPKELALEALSRNEVYVDILDDRLEDRLVELYRAARNTLAEGGANTLFLAIGFLSWIPQDRPGRAVRAPLILIPVVLDRKSVRAGFTLKLHDDEPRLNPTLLEMLRQDFRLELGIDEQELPRDDSGLDVSGILNKVARAVRDLRGWEVSQDVVLAMFSFSKYLMWRDLSERTEQLRENPVVRHLVDTPREKYAQNVAFPRPEGLDKEWAPNQNFCPLPADSSQLAAVLAAARGKDFVLIGPPGTGKSQTIANLIVQCLTDGKRVLFVSEKIAALDVVYRRLRDVGLGEFCLELHSNKARKLDVIDQLRSALEARGESDPQKWLAEAHRLQTLRGQLNLYVERIHHRQRNGMTIYEAIGQVAKGKAGPVIDLVWPSHHDHDTQALANLREAVDNLALHGKFRQQLGSSADALTGVSQSQWSPLWQQRVVASARQVAVATAQVRESANRFAEQTRLPTPEWTGDQRDAVADLVGLLPSAYGRKVRFVVRPDADALVGRLILAKAALVNHRNLSASMEWWDDAVISDCERGIRLLEKRHEVFSTLGAPLDQPVLYRLESGVRLFDELAAKRALLSVAYSEKIEELNAMEIQEQWVLAGQKLWPLSFFGKRKLAKLLKAWSVGDGKPNVAADLETLTAIKALKLKISELELASVTEGVWTGVNTNVDNARAVLNLHRALRAARSEQSWEDAEIGPVAEGLCGDVHSRQWTSLKKLRELDSEIDALGHLQTKTAGVWAGRYTEIDRLRQAVRFVVAVKPLRHRGNVPHGHEAIAVGECGAKLQQMIGKLQERAVIEYEIATFQDLEIATDGVWKGLDTDVPQLEYAVSFHRRMDSMIGRLESALFATGRMHASETAPNADVGQWGGVRSIRDSLYHLLGDNNAALGETGQVTRSGNSVVNALAQLRDAMNGLAEVGGFSESAKEKFVRVPLEAVDVQCQALMLPGNRLKDWCAWRSVCDVACTMGLLPFIEAIEGGLVAADFAQTVFEANYSRWWLNAVVEDEPVVLGFVSSEHSKRIDEFRRWDDLVANLTRTWVRSQLCSKLAAVDQGGKNNEWGILRHEMGKKKRHIPLRQLIGRIPNALTQVTPCLLMSPLSIAQYLDTAAVKFDLVVFDEASQIPVWEAVGAMARGKQVVMVGDTKQLPPSSFFQRGDTGEDDEDVESDLESILDDCIGAGVPQLNLDWHYRSRSESLITFSNHRYYEGRLVTFPKAVTEDRAVRLVAVDGTYARGGTRNNVIEAKAVVADMVGLLKRPGFRESQETIGVVTFNSEQQTLIEDLLDNERRNDPSLESYFAEGILEPIFVKNLESVQGDERDIMYFSVTFGPDTTGVVSMNLGPMNRAGGERRLNVAITRARRELRVFSSLRPEQMNLARTQAQGVRDLKHFLEFAEKGSIVLGELGSAHVSGVSCPLEEAVAMGLRTLGWQVHVGIGASSFRIDLAVVHPNQPGTYMAAVECDGDTYRRAATARDRDKLRAEVLSGLGWSSIRVWSTDWWMDPDGTLQKLDARLRALA